MSQGAEIDGHKPSFTKRLDAAKAAAPFYAHKLQAVEQTGEVVQSASEGTVSSVRVCPVPVMTDAHPATPAIMTTAASLPSTIM